MTAGTTATEKSTPIKVPTTNFKLLRPPPRPGIILIYTARQIGNWRAAGEELGSDRCWGCWVANLVQSMKTLIPQWRKYSYDFSNYYSYHVPSPCAACGKHAPVLYWRWERSTHISLMAEFNITNSLLGQWGLFDHLVGLDFSNSRRSQVSWKKKPLRPEEVTRGTRTASDM